MVVSPPTFFFLFSNCVRIDRIVFGWKKRKKETKYEPTRVFKRADWALISPLPWKKLWGNRGRRREEIFTKNRGRFLKDSIWVTRAEDRANDELKPVEGQRKRRRGGGVWWMAGGINEDGVALGRRRFSLAPRRRLSSAREILPPTFSRTKREFDRLSFKRSYYLSRLRRSNSCCCSIVLGLLLAPFPLKS